MDFVIITGVPGSGKSTLELNIRNQVGASGYHKSSSDGIVFLGRFLSKNGNKFIRYPGLDTVEEKMVPLLSSVENYRYVVMSGDKSLIKCVDYYPQHTFHVLFHRVSKKRIYKQRIKRAVREKADLSWAFSEKKYQNFETRIKKYKKYAQDRSNLKVTVLKGPTLKRIEDILSVMHKSLNDRRIIRSFSQRYVSKFK